MKKRCSIGIFFLYFYTNVYAQTITQNFNTGNREREASTCWYTPGCRFVNTNNELIEGSYTLQTSQLSGGTSTVNGLVSPWVKMNGTGVISFKHKLNCTNIGTAKRIFVTIESATNQNIQDTLFVLDYNSTSATTLKSTVINIPTYTANKVYRVKIMACGTGGNATCLIDDVKINGVYASCPASGCMPILPIVDADNDGVADVDDAFPTDYYRAHKIQYPFNTNGTLLFEDLWPANGDNDFNDLVLHYQYQIITNAANKVVEVKLLYIVKAIGGSLQNGFALQLDNIASAKVIAVARVRASGSLFALANNGTEANQSIANIPIFSSAQALLISTGGIGANINPIMPFVQPDTLKLTITFLNNGVAAAGQTALSINDINFSMFNPYIIAGQQRGKEIHGANKLPTTKATTSFFGTYNDRTNFATNNFYKNTHNLPWMLDIPIIIPHTQESNDIVIAYPKLLLWANSNGINYADWYKDLPGYRIASKLYIR
jgi:LruC domain-containing protein